MKISEGQTYVTAAGNRVKVVGRQKANGGALWIYYGFKVTIDGDRVGPASQLLGWKSDGKDWSGIIGNTILREADTGMKLSLRQAVILERLIEACETDIALPGAVGPRKYGSTFSAAVLSELDIYVLELQELYERGEHEDMNPHTRARNNAISDIDVKRAMCSPSRISRMEEAFEWLGRYIPDHEMRKVIIAFATTKANGDDWSAFIQKRNRKNRSEKPWVKRTLYRWIERGLQIIDAGTRKNGIILRDGSGLQVAHERAETPCKSICSTDLRAAG